MKVDETNIRNQSSAEFMEPVEPTRHRILPVVCILALYLCLLLPTVARQGISWDEQIDLAIAQAYHYFPYGWLLGSEIDPSQMRLPIFCPGVVLEVLNSQSIVVARLVSCAVGALTLIGVYVYGNRKLGRVASLLACALLATSPFFLSFARVAFTESDVYVACTLVWLLVCVDSLLDCPTIGSAAATGITFGLMLSTKATAVVVLPAVWLAVGSLERPGRSSVGGTSRNRIALFVTGLTFALVLGGWNAVRLIPVRGEPGPLRLLEVAPVALGWCLIVAWTLRNRHARVSAGVIVLLITGLAALTFLVLPPEHLANLGILDGLAIRFNQEMTWDPRFMIEAAVLHVSCIVFKSGPVIGIGMLLSWALALLQWRRREVFFPAVAIAFYFGALVLLPLAQTFYTVPLLPALALLTADGFLRLYRRTKPIALALACTASILWVVDLRLTYPDYNLNGFQWLGVRTLAGRSSIGSRSVVQTSSDGVEQSFRWLNQHARPGERVAAYAFETHIISAVAPAPVYQISNALQTGVASDPDYVVVTINTTIPQSWWPDDEGAGLRRLPKDLPQLPREYEKVFAVKRAFGIEIASVWRRRTSHEGHD